MCYNVSYYERRLERLEERLGDLTMDDSVWAGKSAYNASGFANPVIPTISHDRPTEVLPRIWGFHPHYAKSMKDVYKIAGGLINVRDDKLAEKIKANKKFYVHKDMINHPVVILINGFIEWHTLTKPKMKVPYYHKLKNGEMMAVAGISTTFNFVGKTEEHIGVTLMTTSANPMIGHIHNLPSGSSDLRMPALLTPEEVVSWLDTSIDPLERIAMLSAYPAAEMEAYSIQNFLKKDTKHLFNTKEGLEPVDFAHKEAPALVDGALHESWS